MAQICAKARELPQNLLRSLIAGIMAATGQNNPLHRRWAAAFNLIDLRQCAILILCALNGQNRHADTVKRI
jgi:hypothetical protein